jgi:hypothetical protein
MGVYLSATCLQMHFSLVADIQLDWMTLRTIPSGDPERPATPLLRVASPAAPACAGTADLSGCLGAIMRAADGGRSG